MFLEKFHIEKNNSGKQVAAEKIKKR